MAIRQAFEPKSQVLSFGGKSRVKSRKELKEIAKGAIAKLKTHAAYTDVKAWALEKQRQTD